MPRKRGASKGLNKNRLEALSDGVFAIVMTLLVINIQVPEFYPPLTDAQLWTGLIQLLPLFTSYTVSFIVLVMFWISHHMLFHAFSYTLNRQLALLNMIFLMLLALVPFSSHLLGSYLTSFPAIFVYGFNILLLGLTLCCMFEYALRSHEIDNGDVSPFTIHQARIRLLLTPLFVFFGIITAYYSDIKIGLYLFAFPILFNIIPGSLTHAERLIDRLTAGT